MCVHMYYVCMNTQSCTYIFKKTFYVYVLKICIYNVNYMNINIYILQSTHTHIYYVNFYFGFD